MGDTPSRIPEPESDPKSQAAKPPCDNVLDAPVGKPKAEGLKAIVENNVVMVIIGLVFVASAAIYGVLNGWYAREFALKMAQLDSERARIKLTIGNESKLVAPDRVFVDPASLDSTYSVQDGTFAAPAIFDTKGKWTWKTRSELELIREGVGSAELKKLLPEGALKALESSAAQCCATNPLTSVR